MQLCEVSHHYPSQLHFFHNSLTNQSLPSSVPWGLANIDLAVSPSAHTDTLFGYQCIWMKLLGKI